MDQGAKSANGQHKLNDMDALNIEVSSIRIVPDPELVVPESQARYEITSRTKNEDKKTGSYESFTCKKKASMGEVFKERGSGRVGVKDEFSTSETVKIGNKNGYTEYHTEKRFRDVSFGNTGQSRILDAGGSDSDSDDGRGCDRGFNHSSSAPYIDYGCAYDDLDYDSDY